MITSDYILLAMHIAQGSGMGSWAGKALEYFVFMCSLGKYLQHFAGRVVRGANCVYSD